ncbi:hypothetical protein H6P81_012097 [Aristolochia fimbriata]|uniref:F-box domain-containing protein n=1 Tax=Aristolochia fimbriata TaxID=158543 RepID=A0AAV7EB82_ARIFI|nr:hypothetical protein H6P81_012097 [Aristolochia fimbriata]
MYSYQKHYKLFKTNLEKDRRVSQHYVLGNSWDSRNPRPRFMNCCSLPFPIFVISSSSLPLYFFTHDERYSVLDLQVPSMGVSLPGDILQEILSRLPKKSLRRFEIVSKEWENLIREAGSLPPKPTEVGFVYVKCCLQDSIHKTMFYRLDNRGALAVEDSIVFPPEDSVFIMGCCNGVLFYCKEDQNEGKISYHLYDPVARRHTDVPRLPPFRLSFDPIPCAMGFVPPTSGTKHYRFVVVYVRQSTGMYKTHSMGLKIATFPSETGEWKTKPAKFGEESDGELRRLSSFGFNLGAADLCFERNLYWVRSSCLIVLCSETGTFRVITTPVSPNKCRGLVWESEGRLNYGQISLTHGLRIWVLRGVAGNRGLWDTIFHVSSERLDILLAGTVKSSSLKKSTSIARVSAFHEHLQIFHLQTNDGVCVSYDIPNERMALVLPFALDKDASLMPFAYGKSKLPDLQGPESDTWGRRSRKRGSDSCPTLRRSSRLKQAQT